MYLLKRKKIMLRTVRSCLKKRGGVRYPYIIMKREKLTINHVIMVNGKEVDSQSSQQRASGSIHKQRPQKEKRRRVNQKQQQQPHHHLILRLRLLLVLNQPRTQSTHDIYRQVDDKREEKERETGEGREGIAHEDGEC